MLLGMLNGSLTQQTFHFTYNACNNYYMIITCYQHPIILKIELDLAITTIYKHAKNYMATY